MNRHSPLKNQADIYAQLQLNKVVCKKMFNKYISFSISLSILGLFYGGIVQ